MSIPPCPPVCVGGGRGKDFYAIFYPSHSRARWPHSGYRRWRHFVAAHDSWPNDRYLDPGLSHLTRSWTPTATIAPKHGRIRGSRGPLSSAAPVGRRLVSAAGLVLAPELMCRISRDCGWDGLSPIWTLAWAGGVASARRRERDFPALAGRRLSGDQQAPGRQPLQAKERSRQPSRDGSFPNRACRRTGSQLAISPAVLAARAQNGAA